MKTRIGLIFALVSVVSVQCVFDNSSNDDKDSGSETTAARSYMPSTLSGFNSSWHAASYDAAGTAAGTLEYTETISGPDKQGDNTYYYLTSSLFGNDPFRFSIAKNGIYFRADERMFDGHELGEPSLATSSSFGLDFLFFNFSLPVGVTAKVMESGHETDNLYVNIDIDCKRIGNETVTIPAGTFPDCPLFQLTYTVRYTPKISGDVHSFKRVEMHWFGKNTGPVMKTADYFADNVYVSRAVQEMMSYQGQ